MLAGSTADPTTADFFSFHDGRSRTASLPEPAIQRRIWIGSAHGWVVTADEECALHLFNPVIGAQLPLPCITTTGFFQALPRTKSGKATGFLFHESSFLAVHWPDRAFKVVERPVGQTRYILVGCRCVSSAKPCPYGTQVVPASTSS
ncbi:hypothetical protein SETIT_5G265300v2 [Setaria italica]|uniref:KIB1-4 beta-propeller domain-containing protein n=1 Tax=Setaria italica TaxID=4555 RepID=A0A368R9D1_SETIT|nr:hypothetical protein SETIT_5G265300v2 [Setaria italica]